MLYRVKRVYIYIYRYNKIIKMNTCGNNATTWQPVMYTNVALLKYYVSTYHSLNNWYELKRLNEVENSLFVHFLFVFGDVLVILWWPKYKYQKNETKNCNCCIIYSNIMAVSISHYQKHQSKRGKRLPHNRCHHTL